jgi:hypothetical protein
LTATCAISDIRPILRVFVPEATPSVLHGLHARLRGAFYEAQTVLHLGEPELELLELVARHQPQLGEDAMEALARARREPCGIAAPADSRLLDQLANLVPLHAAALGELACELVDALSRERDGAHREEAEPLGEVSR